MSLIETLKQYHQDTVAAQLEKLSGKAAEYLEKQLKEIDFAELDRLIR